MPDSFQEVEQVSLGRNLKNALGGVVVGLLLFVGAFPVLWSNEGRAVRTAQMLEEAGAGVVSIAADDDPATHVGALVHLQGDVVVSDALVDETFGVRAQRAGLRRTVEMYQWVENTSTKEKKKLGGGTEKVTTYTYRKAWRETLVSSGGFKKPEGHQNPSMPIRSSTKRQKSGVLGSFRVASSVLDKMDSWEPLALPEEVAVTAAGTLANRPVVKQPEGRLYVGDPTGAPQLGDLRLQFEQTRQDISVVAGVRDGALVPHPMSGGESIVFVVPGMQSAEAMIQSEQTKNTVWTWVMRLVGFLMMYFGLMAMASPLVALTDVVPFVGRFVEWGVGLIAGLIAAPLSIATIAIAWIVYRPILGASLLALGLVTAFLMYRRGQNRVRLPDGSTVVVPT